jgi:hypothetical protein
VFVREDCADEMRKQGRYNPQNPCPPLLTTIEAQYDTIGYILDNDVFITAPEKVFPISHLPPSPSFPSSTKTNPFPKTVSKTLLPPPPPLGKIPPPRQNNRHRILPLPYRAKTRKTTATSARKEKSQKSSTPARKRYRARKTRRLGSRR